MIEIEGALTPNAAQTQIMDPENRSRLLIAAEVSTNDVMSVAFPIEKQVTALGVRLGVDTDEESLIKTSFKYGADAERLTRFYQSHSSTVGRLLIMQVDLSLHGRAQMEFILPIPSLQQPQSGQAMADLVTYQPKASKYGNRLTRSSSGSVKKILDPFYVKPEATADTPRITGKGILGKNLRSGRGGMS